MAGNLAERLTLILGVEGQDEFKKALRKGREDVEDESKKMGEGFKGFLTTGKLVAAGIVAAVGAMTAAVVGMAKAVADAGDKWEKMAKRTGIAEDELSALGFAADRSGASIQSLENGLRRLAANAQEATRSGTGPAAEAFQVLGLNVKDAHGQLKSTDALLMELADTLGQMEDATMASALAQDLFGKSGTELLPLLKEGSAGIDTLKKRARELGIVYSTELAGNSAAFMDATTDLSESMRGLKIAITEQVIPAITTLMNEVITPAIVKMQQFVSAASGIWDMIRILNNSYVPRPWSNKDELGGTPAPPAKPGFVPPGIGLLNARNARAARQAAQDRAEMMNLPMNYAWGGEWGDVSEENRAHEQMVKQLEDAKDLWKGHAEDVSGLMVDVVDEVIPSWERVPKSLEDNFSTALANVEAQMAALGMRGQGIFGGILNVRAGLTGLGVIKPDATGMMGMFSSILSKAGFAGQIASGVMAGLSGLKSLFGGGTPAGTISGLGSESTESLQATLRYIEQNKAGGGSDKTAWAMQAQIEAELSRRGVSPASGGSQSYSSVSSITMEQANSLVALTETLRIQDARRNELLESMDSKLGNIEFATTLGTTVQLMRFQGL